MNEAVLEYRNDSNVTTENFCLTDIEDAFEAGAQWLMTQPLSDRLTDEEKEKIKKLHAEAVLFGDFESADNIEPLSHYHGRKVCMELIFGAELFNQPTEV